MISLLPMCVFYFFRNQNYYMEMRQKNAFAVIFKSITKAYLLRCHYWLPKDLMSESPLNILCSCVYMCQSLSPVLLIVNLWIVAHQAPLSVGFSRKKPGEDCHFLRQGIFRNQRSNLHLLSLCIGR